MFNSLAQNNKADITLIMPVLNGSNSVIPVIATLAFTVKYPLELLVVYDTDNDTTIPVVEELKKLFPNIRLIKNKGERLIGAIQTGIGVATAETVGIWLSYHVDPYGLLNDMYELIINEGCDLVSGNRFSRGKSTFRGSLVKKLLSRLGNYVYRDIIGIPLGDVTTSMKIYKKSLLNRYPIETGNNGGWAISTEYVVKAAMEGNKFGEIEFMPKNTNLIHGLSNFKIYRQLSEYLKWLVLGFHNRKLIKSKSNSYLH